ncbi:MAG: flavin reductase family protein [Lachnospiraceae bacterium]|jgi:flavin reductase (DIM6/NTAB) family NADH-FMN oxidoreductase RutF|nr:flavin reductase family protein [Lachnospiraceae bacterium]MCI9400659.1 flavin reductase family protein [Lachnospiraceae bacterium]
MAKTNFKAGNMLYPLPAVLVSVADKQGNTNILTIAWAGTVCTNPPMVSISVRPSRFSHHMLMESREFVINLTTKELVFATDYCGVKSGREVDKWKELHLTPLVSQEVAAPSIAESPVNIECKVERVEHLGSHDLFLASVVAVRVDNRYMDQNGSFHLEKAQPIVYSHGEYYDLGAKLGKFGYSIQKNRGRKTKKTQ